MALLTGQIEGLSMLDYDRVRHVEFSGRMWSWVDPLKDVEAAKAEILLGINSRQAVARDRAKSFTKILAENEEDQKAMDKAGISYEKAGQADKPATEEKPPPEE
jgi:capsid protein